MKKIILLSLLLVSGYSLAAERCPSIAEVKQGNFRGWQLLMKNHPATDVEMKEFIQGAERFNAAYWASPQVPHKSWDTVAVCTYYPITSEGYTLDKYNLPKPAGKGWHPQYDDTSYECLSDVENCSF